MSNQKRKRLLVDPFVQWALARRLCYHWVAFFSLVLGVGAILKLLFSVSVHGFAGAAAAAFRDQLPLMALMLLILPLFIRDSLRLSNKFAGPMYRIRRSLEDLGEGKSVQVIKLRSGDFWQETAFHLNSVRERLNVLETRKGQLELENRQLREALRERSEELTSVSSSN